MTKGPSTRTAVTNHPPRQVKACVRERQHADDGCGRRRRVRRGRGSIPDAKSFPFPRQFPRIETTHGQDPCSGEAAPMSVDSPPHAATDADAAYPSARALHWLED